jgi:muramoyltetrapeptide carboxypeptidase
MMMKSPAPLQIGDTVAIVSTARKISPNEIQFAINTLESWGLKIILGKTLEAEHHQFAGDDDVRAKDFQQMMDDNQVKAIICARGGYGTVRILDQLDFTQFTHHTKWIVGYSDVTALHAHINTYLYIQTLHATMPINFENNTKESLESLKNVLFGQPHSIKCNTHPLNIAGTAKGEIVGGNLSILYSILGTKSGISTDNKILFIEDLDEYLYHIDRMMIALKRAGKLNKIKALIVGGMTDMKDNAVPFGKTAEEIILDTVKEYNIPVCFGFPAGHINDNRAIPFGKKALLQITPSETTLIFE